MSDSYNGQICKFCANKITEEADISVCTLCNKPQHTACWKYNLSKCSTFGCKGNPVIVVRDIPEPKKIDLNEVIKPQKVMPRPLKPVNNPKLQRKIPRSVPKPPPYIPDYVNMPWEEFKRREEQDKRRAKMLSYRSRYQYPPVVIAEEERKISYKTIPKPEPFVPEYVFKDMETYLRQKSRKKNVRKGTKYLRQEPPFFPAGQKPEQEYYSYPKAEPYVPDFVFTDIETYYRNKLKEEKLRQGRKVIKSSVKIRPRPEKKLSYQTVPKPEPYIPDYVFADYKEFLWNEYYKKKKKRLPRVLTQKKVPELQIENYSDALKDYIPVEKPEPYVPDFVFSSLQEYLGEEKEEKISIFDDKITSKECPICLSKLKLNTLKCPYCRYYFPVR